MQNEITELRNQVRTLKRIVYGFGCLLVAGIVVGATTLQTVPDVIRAKVFQVVNDDGVVVASFKARNRGKGAGVLAINNKEGEIKALLSVDEEGGRLLLTNKGGALIAGLGVDKYGGMLGIRNKDGKSVAVLLADKNGNGKLEIQNGKGKVIFEKP